ncbi:hypothetical protein QOM21_20280 [Streptomyces sp. Pv4-95]|uniref:hypothetical protein n=1 Tax=Streptomyces sp. Pv4-95 TaxID=3049543 RepID=UPI003891B435
MFSIAQAEAVGYNHPKEGATASESGWDEKAPKVQRDLLDGSLKEYRGSPVPKGGCVADTADELTKNSRVPKKIEGGGVQLKQLQKSSPTSLGSAQVGIIRLDAIFSTKKNYQYMEMIRSWSSCMSKKGYIYKIPETAVNDDRWRGDEASEREKRTAVADMRCKDQVNYLGVSAAIQSAYEEKVVKERRGELTQLRRNLKAWKANAEDALRGPGGDKT